MADGDRGKPQLLSQDSDPESGAEHTATKDPADRVGFILKISLSVAFCWWFFGLYTVLSTRSLAVLASLVDATIDLLAQGVLLGINWVAESGTVKGVYPVGVSRLEPVGVIICAVIMTLGSGGVIYDSADCLWQYFPSGPEMEFTIVAASMLAAVVVVKVVVWQVAKSEYEKTKNISLEALALDNFNDILSNSASLVFASLTTLQSWTWWLDPLGAIFISLYIIRSWGLTGIEQASQLVGIQADDEILDRFRGVAQRHCGGAELDMVRAYHFGPKCMVEIKLLMEPCAQLQQIRDVSIKLQHEIESIDECERCFVQVDYVHREADDHDNLVPLQDKVAYMRRRMTSGLRLRTVLSFAEEGKSNVVDIVGSRHRFSSETHGQATDALKAASSTEAPKHDRLISSSPRTIKSRDRDGR